MRSEILRIERVAYTDKSGIRLEDFSLQIFEGEIMGLLPINAYGLPALLEILRCNPTLYDGYIYYRNKQVNSWQDAKRSNSKISFIRDKSSLIDGQSVAYNIFVLRPGFKPEILNSRLIKQQLKPFVDEIQLSIPLDTMVEKLSFFERVVVEILRAVVAGHRLIILQEISTMVNEKELMKLYGIMKHYTEQGFSFLYISPHFEDIVQVCSRAAIMKNGHIIKVLEGQKMKRATIQFYSREYDGMVRNHLEWRQKLEEQPIAFEAQGISGTYVENLNFNVRKGECLVIQLLESRIGNELLEIFLGKKTLQGSIYINGKKTKLTHNREIAVLQEEPTKSMLFYDMSYMDNLCFTMDHRIRNLWLGKKIRKNIQSEYETKLGKEVFDKQIEDLTEMEKYDLIYMRIFLQRPQVVFCILPFKGADMIHRIRIWALQEMFLKKGIALVIFAVNMSDTLSLADRVIRIHKHTHITEYLRKDFSKLPSYIPWQYLYEEDTIQK